MRRPSLLTIACLAGLTVLAVRAWRERVPPPVPAATAPVALLNPVPLPAVSISTGDAARVAAPVAGPPAPAAPVPVAPTNAPSAVEATPSAPAVGTIKLEGAQLERLVTGPGVADMRMLTLTLRVDPRGGPLHGEDVRVHTRFYLQDALSRVVSLAEAAETELTLRGRLEPDQVITLTRPFVLAAPSPDAETGSSTRAFHGYRVDVYLEDRLVATEARPPSLAQP